MIYYSGMRRRDRRRPRTTVAESNAPPAPSLLSPTRGTRAPIRTGICSYPCVPSGMSCGVSSRIPDRPSRSRSQTSCVPTPSGVASPMPVTTTRRGGTVGGGWSNPRQATPPSSSPHPRRDDDADDEINLFTAVHGCTSSDARARSMGRDDAARTSRSASRAHVPDRARRASQARPEHHGLAARRPVTRGTKKKGCLHASRAHAELNHGPVDLQSTALPLSYEPSPCAWRFDPPHIH